MSTTMAKPHSRLREALTVHGLQLLIVAVVLLSWQAASGHFLPSYIISRPTTVAHDLGIFLTSQAGWRDIAATYEELILGYAIGVGAGFFVGITLGANRFLARIFEPLITVVNGVPHITLAPMFIVLFGLGISSKVAVAALGVFFIMFYNSYTGIRAVRRDHLDCVRLFGASRTELLRYVVVPGMMPSFLAGLRLGFVFALVGAIVGEFISAQQGVGAFIVNSQNLLNAGNVFAGMFVLMAMVFIGNQLFRSLQRHLLRWTEVSR